MNVNALRLKNDVNERGSDLSDIIIVWFLPILKWHDWMITYTLVYYINKIFWYFSKVVWNKYALTWLLTKQPSTLTHESIELKNIKLNRKLTLTWSGANGLFIKSVSSVNNEATLCHVFRPYGKIILVPI